MTRSRDIADQQDNLGGAVAPYVGAKNFVINGGFDFWQRGTSYVMTGLWAYGAADRWGFQQYPTGLACTVTRSTDVPVGTQYSLKMQRTASSTNTSSMSIMQCVESTNVIPLQGKTVVLSFWAKAGANFSGTTLNAKIQTGTVADQELGLANGSYTGNIIAGNTSPTITTTWTRYFLVATLTTNIKEMSINLNWAGAGTAGADDSVYIAGVQLEIGSQATPFSRAGGSIGGELALCQRYYFRTTGGGAFQPLCFGFASSSTNVMGYLQFPVTMRTSPTSIDFSSIQCNDSTTGVGVSAVAFNGTEYGPQAATLNFTTGGMTTFRPTKILQNSTSAGYLGLSAEL